LRYCVSFLRLLAEFTTKVLHRELVILLRKHFTLSASGGIMSGPRKGLRLLRPSEIYELIVDTDSDEARMSSNVSSVEGSSESVTGVSQPQPYCQTASCHESSSSFSPNAFDEEDAGESGPGEQTQGQ
jgi:hypothetical protein